MAMPVALLGGLENADDTHTQSDSESMTHDMPQARLLGLLGVVRRGEAAAAEMPYDAQMGIDV